MSHRFYRQPFRKPIRPQTWDDLTAAEPMLATLESIINRMAVPDIMPDYWRAWSRIKATMSELCGWEAVNPALRSEAAYYVAHDHLLDLYERRAAEIAEAQGGDGA